MDVATITDRLSELYEEAFLPILVSWGAPYYCDRGLLSIDAHSTGRASYGAMADKRFSTLKSVSGYKWRK